MFLLQCSERTAIISPKKPVDIYFFNIHGSVHCSMNQ